MTTGEKLYSAQCIIYDFANRQFSTMGLDATLSEIVIGNVHRKFSEAAYEASLYEKVQSQMEPPKVEHYTTAPEESNKECEN